MHRVQLSQWVVWSDGKIDRPVVVSQSEQGGAVVVIADTHFATNENLETAETTVPDNIRFWRWLLSHVVTGQKPWNPPPASKAAPTKNTPAENSDDEDDKNK